MSEDNTTVAVTETQENRGPRGEVGVATASLTIKQRWQKQLSMARQGNLKSGTLSLKQFARVLVKSDDANAKEWFANKAGVNNQERSAANAQMAKTCAGATKMARKKSKGGGKAKPAAAV